MIGFKVQAISKGMFFDSEAVMKAVSAADRKVLSKFGAFVRTTARRSIRPAVVKNKKAVRAAKKAGTKTPKIEYQASQPGEAPRSRQGDLKRFILFGYEPEARNVVIGPTLVGDRASETPHRLEYGGEFRSKKTGKTIKVAKRPFMKPAFDKELARMPAMFADSL